MPATECKSATLRIFVCVVVLGAAAQGLGDGGEEGRQAGGTADELGDEDGGVVLRLGAVDPLQWRGRTACFVCIYGSMRSEWSERPRQSITDNFRKEGENIYLPSHTTCL